jgi:hypothetical protein
MEDTMVDSGMFSHFLFSPFQLFSIPMSVFSIR